MPDDEARKKRHIADAVYAFRNGGDDAAKTAAAIALLGNRKELVLDEVLGEATVYTVRLSYKKKGEEDVYESVREVKFTDKEAADKFEKELKAKYKDDANVLISQSTAKDKVTAKEALEFLRNEALSGDTSRLRLVAGDYLCRLSHIAEDGFDILAGKLIDAKKKSDAAPDDEDLKKDLAAKKKAVEQAKKFADLARFDYTDMVGACFEVLASEHAPKELKGEAIVGKTGPRLDFLLEYFRFKVEPGLNDLPPDARNEALANLYKRDSNAIEAVLQGIAKDKNADPDLRALAVSVLSANTAMRPTVNGQPLSLGSTVDIGSKTGRNVYIEAKGEGVAERHATITANRDGTFSIAALGKNEVWIKRPGEKEPTYIKVGADKTDIKPGDQVILGDKEKGAVLKFGTEREGLLARIHKEWSENSDKPGKYAELVRGRLKADLTLDTDNVSPLGGQDDLRVNKFRAALALDHLQDLAGFPTDGDRTIALNKALMECFDTSRPRLAMAVLEKLTEPLPGEGNKTRLDTLTIPQLKRLRVLCTSALTMRGLTGEVTDDVREKVDLKIAITENLPKIFKGADVGQLAQVVQRLQCFLSPDMKDDSNPFPSKFASLREPAVVALAKLSPETARLVLPDVARNDLVETVRLKALEMLVEIGHPQLRELCIERLTTETDPLILKRLRRMEWFERRPDRGSEEYQKEFRKASADIKKASDRSLVGFETLYDKKKGIDNLTPWSREKEIVSKWRSQFFVKNKGYPSSEEEAAYIKSSGLKNYPYYEPFIKACVYAVVSDGKGADETNNLGRRNRAQDGAVCLREICQQLVAMKDDRAKDLVWAMEACVLKGGTHPTTRGYAVDGLETLCKGGVISKEEFAVTIATLLESEARRIPRDQGKGNINFEFEDAEALQHKLMGLLKEYKTPVVTPILEAIVDEEKYPFPKVREKAKALLFEMRERTGYFKDVYVADGKASEADLAKPLKAALLKPNLDADAVCKALCQTFNGRPIAKADDERRALAYMAAGDSHPKVRYLAAEFLMQSKVKEDRERAAEVLAGILIRKPTEGTTQDAQALVDDIKKNPKNYQEGDLALVEKAIAAVKEEEARKLVAALGWASSPYANLLGVPLITPESPKRADYTRDLDYQAAYEKALSEIKRSWESKIPRHYQEFDLKGHKYGLLSPYTFREEWGEAVRDRYGASTARRFEKLFHSKEKIQEEESAAGQAVIDNMWKQYDDLRKKALDKDGDFERLFLQFVIRRQGSPFLDSFQADAMDKAADTILQICKLKAPGAGDMEGFLAGVLIDDPTLQPGVRKKLLEAYLELVEPKGKISKERAAITLAAVLRTEYQNTPKADQPGYKESEERQLLILKQLHEWKTHMVSAVLEAIAKDHSIPSVKTKAAEILKDFASKDVEDVLKFGRNLGSATILADDPRLAPIVAAMNDEKRPIEERFRAANLIMTNGADDVKAKHKVRALLVACDAAAKSENNQVKFDAARLLLSVPADDMKFTRSYAARALANLAIAATPGIALESQALLKKMNDEERKIAAGELSSIIEKSKDKGQQANAAILMLQLCDNNANVLADFYKGEALTKLIDLALTGDEDLRGRLKGVLGELSPKQCLIAANSALKWAEDHKGGDKSAIADALMLSAAFVARADKETKSPAMMFNVVEKAEKLLGKDDDTTKELAALVSGIKRDSLLKPIAGADAMEVIAIWRALRSDNEETKLGAALTLVDKRSKGVDDTYKFSAIDTLAELAEKGKSAEVRKVAEARLKELVSELAGPMVVDDRRAHWLYGDSQVLKLAAAKTILFDTGSQVTGEDRGRAIIALSSVAIEGNQLTRKEAETLLFKLKGEELDKAVDWLETMAFIAGRKETPDKERMVSCWKLAEKLYEKAGVDPTSEKYLRVTLGRKRAEGKADSKELEELADRIADRQTERSKDPTAKYEEDRLDRYFKEYEAARKKYGEGSLEVARAQLALAKVAYCRSFESDNPTVRGNTGRMAEYHAKAAEEVFRKKLPADSVELCDALYRLGIAEMRQGKWEDAQKHLKESLDIYKKQKDKIPGTDGVWIASHLARAYIATGKYEEAAKVNQDLVEFSKKKVDVLQGSEILRALKLVAASYPQEFEEEKKTARAKDVEPLLRQALAVSKEVNGEKDNDTVWIMALLAKNLGEQKKDKEALPLFETAIKHYKAQPKTDKQKLADLVVAYGDTLFNLDKKKEADAAWEEARQLRVAHEADQIHFRQDWFKRLLGDGEPTLLSNDELEKVYKAKDVAFEKLRAAEKKYGEDSLEAGKERLKVSELFLKASMNTGERTPYENCARAAMLHSEAGLKILEDKLEKDHPDLAMAHYQVAMTQLWAGKDEDAVEHLKQALAIALKNPDKVESGDAIWIASRLVLANIKAGDQEGMDKALATLIDLAGKKPGKSSRGDVSRALDQVIIAVSNPLNTNKKPREKEAEKLLKLALEISKKHNGEDSVPTAILTVRQAAGLAKKADYESADPLYKKAISLLEKKENFPREELADILQLYSVCLEELKRPEEAKALAKRAKELRKPLVLAKD
ncbi:MAG: hypothetical protein C5B53_02335 [Candidatus Melainabacteria bacterium]|nr:MAG: hypothetical protein C5B53_02335 [Candidatus Melainabacteria bacterium]